MLQNFGQWLIVLVLLVAHQVSSGNMQSTMVALEALYSSTHGENWKWVDGNGTMVGVHWNFTKTNDGYYLYNPCAHDQYWQGICCCNLYTTNYTTSCLYQLDLSAAFSSNPPIPQDLCNSVNDTIVGLSLNQFNLKGPLPSQLFSMTSLAMLTLYDNLISSTLPTQINTLEYLTTLDFNTNYLTGQIPAVGNLRLLTLLDFSFNLMSGTIPALNNLTALATLYIQSNHLTGTVSPFVSSCTNIHLRNNLLSGSVPSNLAQLTGLQSLSMRGNFITGTIPTSVCTSSVLYYLGLSVNNIVGTIPTCISKITGFIFLWLYENNMVGPIPSLVASKDYLTNVLLSRNSFSGNLLSNIGELAVLNTLDLSSNRLTGTIPSSMGQLKALTYLSLADNQFTGTLTRHFAFLSRLQVFFVGENLLHGELNSVFSNNQSSLVVVDLSDNSFTGVIPTSLFALPRLKAAVLIASCFTGGIPESICLSSSLQALAMDGLSAGSACERKLLLKSYAASHYMSGSVPECLFRMPQLEVLQLSGNGLAGGLPQVALSSNLVQLSLSSNQLTGTIPLQFQQHPFQLLELSNNRFSGTITDMTGFYTEDSPPNQKLSLNINRLSGLLPVVFQDAENIQVVAGNVFGCRPNAGLPSNDPGSTTNECGSDMLNKGLISWIVVICTSFGSFAVLAWCVTQVRHLYQHMRHSLLLVYSLSRGDLFAKELPNVQSYFAIASRLTWVTIFGALTALVVMMPFSLLAKCVLDSLYSTHAVQYAYTPSLAYLSGVMPASVTWVIVALLMVGVRVVVKMSKSTQEESHQRAVVESITFAFIKKAIVLSCVNIILILLVNLGYLYVVFRYDSTIINLARFALVGFKLFWNIFVLPFALRGTNSVNGRLLNILMLFNNVVIPVLTTACSDPNCFLNVFVSSAPVTVSYTYIIPCGKTILANGTCIDSQATASRSYSAPFLYSYQCSSTVLGYYIPVYVLLYIYYTCISPLLNAGAMYLYWARPGDSRLEWLLDNTVGYGVMKSRHHFEHMSLEQPDDSSQAMAAEAGSETITLSTWQSLYNNTLFMNAQDVLVQLTCHMAILLTFGMAYPLLAVLITCAVVMEVWRWSVIVGWYLSHCLSTDSRRREVMLQMLNRSCTGIAGIVSFSSGIVVIVIALFFSLFVLDMAGDKADDHIVKILWPPLALILWLLIVLVAHRLPMPAICMSMSGGIAEDVSVVAVNTNNSEDFVSHSIELSVLDEQHSSQQFNPLNNSNALAQPPM